jgi:hypothetical protein
MNVTVAGNLCADPELRHTPGNVAVAELRIAENRHSKDPDGEWRTPVLFAAPGRPLLRSGSRAVPTRFVPCPSVSSLTAVVCSLYCDISRLLVTISNLR